MQRSVAPESTANGRAARVSWSVLLGFGQLAVPLAFASLPIAIFVTRFYAQDLQIGIADVGFILLAARLADIIVDPIIGFVSDRVQFPFGRRKTWVLLGAPIFALGVYMLFLPPTSLAEASEDARRLYLLTWIAAPRLPAPQRFLIALFAEAGWEILENTPYVINVYRQQALAQGYVGDSILNSVSDVAMMSIGFLLAWRLPASATVALAIGLELFVGWSIRDNLTLNLLNFIHEFEFIKHWQNGG